jgi:hypothetical protein
LTLSTTSGETDEEEQVQRRADGPDSSRGRSREQRRGDREEARHQRPDDLHLAQAVRRDDAGRHAQAQGAEGENAKLKKLLADRLLEIDVLKEINAKKW